MTKKNPKKIYKELSKLDYSIVERKVIEQGYSSKIIPRMRRECLRFVSLCAVSTKPLSPSDTIDQFWHNMVLCTKQYVTVGKICGKFIHHNPNDGSKKAKAEDTEAFWNTLDEYEKIFGKPDLEVWQIEKRGNKHE